MQSRQKMSLRNLTSYVFKSIKALFKCMIYLPWNYILKMISRHVSWTQWKLLLELKFQCNPLLNPQCCYYGLGKIAKKYGVKNLLRCCIDHGVSFSSKKDVLKQRMVSRNLLFPILDYCVFSQKDKEMMTQILEDSSYSRKAKVHSLGPYILFADNFYSHSKLQELKKEYGKTLLVFPMHSAEFFDYKYDAELLIKKIEEIKKDFKSVIVCIYWHDLIFGREKKYLEKNYIVVCCGRREDPFFLSRQKDLFSLSDMTITNGAGTHIGYSIAMGVPCYLFKQDYELLDRGNFQDDPNYVFMKEGFYDAFSYYSFEITSTQRELVRKWWGDFKY